MVDAIGVAGVSRKTFYELFEGGLWPRHALRQFTGFLESGRSETSVELPGITSIAIAGGDSEILHGAVSRLPSRLPT